ncbi:hypothetical protein ABZY09_44495 [Streptomyces sp. NPDC002928]|uniref:hypothetical protein n=1 Tax=Streptomyces sp. NPDC002928 TaxID=3154440 RepID=UPI0033AA4C09
MTRYRLARALLHLDPRRAERLVGQVQLADREEFQSVDRIAVPAVIAPDLAAESVERMSARTTSGSWTSRPMR